MRALVCHRVLVGAEHRKVLALNLGTVVDIGANRGQFALAARNWVPGARVISFEPLSQAAARFRKLFHNDPKVALHEAAIGPEKGEVVLHVSGADDSSSLLPISSLQEETFPGTGEVDTETVTVGRLADFISAEEIIAPAMLKLDVQGYELEALRGCEELLSQFVYLYVECSFKEFYSGQALADEIIAWLRERGFRIAGVYNICCDCEGRTIQADFLFYAPGS